MPDIARYWSLVAEQRTKLLRQTGLDVSGLTAAEMKHFAKSDANVIYITSLTSEIDALVGGRVFGVTVELAAQRIIEHSHRLATEEEIKRYHDEQDARNRICNEIEARKRMEKGGVQVSVDRDTAEAMGIVPPRATPKPAKEK